MSPVTVEEWRPVDFAPNYEVSNLGGFRSWKNPIIRGTNIYPRPLATTLGSNGYPRIRIAGHAYFLHRIVARVFLGPCPSDKEVNHIDAQVWNACVDNLEYVTHSSNTRHAVRMGHYARGVISGVAAAAMAELCGNSPRQIEKREYRRRNAKLALARLLRGGAA